jgi:hypothetical protein
MLNSGGASSTNRRREVDLYVEAENVDDLYQRFKDRVEVVEACTTLLRHARIYHP